MKLNATLRDATHTVSPPTEHAARPLMMLPSIIKCQFIHFQKKRKKNPSLKHQRKRKRVHMLAHQDRPNKDGTHRPTQAKNQETRPNAAHWGVEHTASLLIELAANQPTSLPRITKCQHIHLWRRKNLKKPLLNRKKMVKTTNLHHHDQLKTDGILKLTQWKSQEMRLGAILWDALLIVLPLIGHAVSQLTMSKMLTKCLPTHSQNLKRRKRSEWAN